MTGFGYFRDRLGKDCWMVPRRPHLVAGHHRARISGRAHRRERRRARPLEARAAMRREPRFTVMPGVARISAHPCFLLDTNKQGFNVFDALARTPSNLAKKCYVLRGLKRCL
jgi:hypothetical protein